MASSIEPIGPQHRASLKEHLARYGLPPDIVEWKYYGRGPGEAPKGLVWIREGRVQGTIGMIPFTLRVSGEDVPAAWTCDWLVEDPKSSPGIGISLLRHARSLVDPLFSLGGNDTNRKLMPRMAAATVEAAADEWHLPLRAGGFWWFDGLQRRAPILAGAVEGLPIPFGRRPAGGRAPSVQVVEGVAEALEPVLARAQSPGCGPRYDVPYLRWQIEACPALVCASVFVRTSTPTAAAVCWAPRQSKRRWRVALWGNAPADDQVTAVLAAAIAHVRAEGATRLAIVASRDDLDRHALLRRFGFSPAGEQRALYVLSGRKDVSGVTPLVFSFVDSDLAYRF